MDAQQEMIRTLENIELLANSGAIGNPLTDIMARLHIAALRSEDVRTDALERAAAFIVSCEREFQTA